MREQNPQQEDHGEMPCAFQEASMEAILSHEAESLGRLFKEVARIGGSFEAAPNNS